MCCVRDVTSWGGGQPAALKRPKTMSAKVKQKEVLHQPSQLGQRAFLLGEFRGQFPTLVLGQPYWYASPIGWPAFPTSSPQITVKGDLENDLSTN